MSSSDTLRLNCPKCQRGVRVRAAAIGKRVRCPQCQAEFKVPGQPAAPAPAADDADDWLNFDQPLPEPPPPDVLPQVSSRPPVPTRPPADSPTGAQGAGAHGAGTSGSQPPAVAAAAATGAAEEHDPYQLFDEPLPPANLRPTNQPSAAKKSFTEDDLQALSGALGPAGWDDDDHLPSATGAPPAAAAADVPPPDSEFRVSCPVCQSLIYARRDQAGQTIRCHDCFSEFQVPKPPRPKPKYKPDLEKAEVFSLEAASEHQIYGDPMAKSAAQLLREAEAADDEEEPDNQYDNPDVVGWLKGIFRIFLDPGVLLHWISLSLIGAVPGVIAVAVGHPSLITVTLGGALLYGAFVMACGFAILETVANGERTVSEWPYLDPAEWLGRLFTVVAALALAGGPAWALGSMVFGASLATVAFTMLAIYVLFPFILLSILESGSVLTPFSAEVSKSVTRCQESWGVLYLSAGLLFFFLFLVFVATRLMPPTAGVVVNVFVTVGATFTYFSMIGQLAYAIGHAVNAPPMKNDIQQQREAERQRKAELGD